MGPAAAPVGETPDAGRRVEPLEAQAGLGRGGRVEEDAAILGDEEENEPIRKAGPPTRYVRFVGRPRGGYIDRMNTETHELLTQALRLPVTARAALAASLIESLETDPPDEGVEAAWQAEVERRAAEIDRGDAKTIPWSEVQRRMMDAGRGQAR